MSKHTQTHKLSISKNDQFCLHSRRYQGNTSCCTSCCQLIFKKVELIKYFFSPSSLWGVMIIRNRSSSISPQRRQRLKCVNFELPTQTRICHRKMRLYWHVWIKDNLHRLDTKMIFYIDFKIGRNAFSLLQVLKIFFIDYENSSKLCPSVTRPTGI